MSGYFRGLAASFRVVATNSPMGEPVLFDAGAFAKSLRVAQSTQQASGSAALFPLLWMGDPAHGIGGVLSATETEDGLVIEAECDVDNSTEAQDVFSGISRGYIGGLMVVGTVTQVRRDANKLLHVTEFNLWGVGVATMGFGMGPDTIIDRTSIQAEDSEAEPPAESDLVGFIAMMSRDLERMRMR